jgi:hypothetical protein
MNSVTDSRFVAHRIRHSKRKATPIVIADEGNVGAVDDAVERLEITLPNTAKLS